MFSCSVYDTPEMSRGLPSTTTPVIGPRHWRISAADDRTVTEEDRQRGAGFPPSAPTTGHRPQIGVRDILDVGLIAAAVRYGPSRVETRRYSRLSLTYIAFLEDVITLSHMKVTEKNRIPTATSSCSIYGQ